MTSLDLQRIRERAEKLDTYTLPTDVQHVVEGVPDLCSEVARLRSLIRAEHSAGAQNAAGACGCEVCRG